MLHKKFLFCLLVLVVSISSLQGCAPSYPTKEEMISAVIKICKEEYKIEVKAAINDNTLGVYMPIDGLFQIDKMQISEDAIKGIDGVMMTVSRVSLSGSREIDFYTVVAADKNIHGAEVVLTRYIRDLHRYFFKDISRGEFAKRMIMDVRLNLQGVINLGGEFTVGAIKIEDFITKQISRRIRDEFQSNKDLIGKFKVSEVIGLFRGNEFNFILDISREGLPMSELIHGKGWRDDILLIAAKVIAHVIWAYSFDNFSKISITNKFDDRKIEIQKEDIKRYRKLKIKIE